MKRRIGHLAWLLLAVTAIASAGPARFPAEGVWRGEFTVDGEAIPFNFEVKGKNAKAATFTLLNGTRRDDFVVERVSEDTLSVPMNTYDAALSIRIVDGKHLSGEYQDLVPNRKGARNLPFTAEHGKSWRFVEPGKDVKPKADLSGKWSLTQAITGNTVEDGEFKVPSLRNVAVTAPYMHDGSFGTLREVIDYYDDPERIVPGAKGRDATMSAPLKLTEGEKADLEAFLRALTDDQFAG